LRSSLPLSSLPSWARYPSVAPLSWDIVRECDEAGVMRVWMHQSLTSGSSVSPTAVEFCRQHDIDVIAGARPMMYGSGVDFGHRYMRVIMKLTGGLPT
jgi:hypothetical protein